MKSNLKNKAMSSVVMSFIAAIAVTLIFISAAHAGDCRKVKFKFFNDHEDQIKVQKVKIVGNDKTWNEDIKNKTIDAGGDDITNGRRLNGLDSGKSGKFTVIYKRLNSADKSWIKEEESFGGTKDSAYECWDNRTYVFRLPAETSTTVSSN